jgi:hypothetical protein
MRRREFIGLAGGLVVWPHLTREAVAQKALPRVGFMASGAPNSINSELQISAIKRGLGRVPITPVA